MTGSARALPTARWERGLEDIARGYGVTTDMARFRLNTTGAARPDLPPGVDEMIEVEQTLSQLRASNARTEPQEPAAQACGAHLLIRRLATRPQFVFA